MVGGNVSFYNESEGSAIYPTPVVGAVGLLDNVEHHATASFKKPGDTIMLLGEPELSLGGSSYLQVVHGRVEGQPARLDLQREIKVQKLVRGLIKKQLLSSAHDLSEGGLAVALAESCLLGDVGAAVDLPSLGKCLEHCLFGEGSSLIVVSLPEENREEVEREANELSVETTFLGEVTASLYLNVNESDKEVINLELEQLREAWKGSLKYDEKVIGDANKSIIDY